MGGTGRHDRLTPGDPVLSAVPAGSACAIWRLRDCPTAERITVDRFGPRWTASVRLLGRRWVCAVGLRLKLCADAKAMVTMEPVGNANRRLGKVRPAREQDRSLMVDLLRRRWGSVITVSRRAKGRGGGRDDGYLRLTAGPQRRPPHMGVDASEAVRAPTQLCFTSAGIACTRATPARGRS